MKAFPTPETGGRWLQDPKTGALTQVEEPTEFPMPEAAPAAESAPAGETPQAEAPADTRKKGTS